MLVISDCDIFNSDKTLTARMEEVVSHMMPAH
jgi:hypothetical protein